MSSAAPAPHEMIFSPGATTSGLGRPSPVGPLGREVRHAVDVRHVAVRRADRDRAVGVSGIVDAERETRRDGAAVDRVGVPVPGVPRRDDDDHARAHEPIHDVAQRTLSAGEPLRVEIVADAQVHAVNLDVLAVAVHAVDRLQRDDHVAHRPATVGAEHLEAHDRGLWRDTTDCGQRHDFASDRAGFVAMARDRGDRLPVWDVGQRQLAGDDPRDVRPMAEFVDERRAGRARRRGEVGVRERRLEQQRLVFSKVRMIALHSRVEHRPHDPAAARRERRECGVGLDGAHGVREQRLHLEVGPDVEDHPGGGIRRAPGPAASASRRTSARMARPSRRAKTYWSLRSVLR